MTNYKRYETITAWELRKIAWFKCLVSLDLWIDRKGCFWWYIRICYHTKRVYLCENKDTIRDRDMLIVAERYSVSDDISLRYIERIEIEQPEPVVKDYLTTENHQWKDDNDNEWLDRLYWWEIEKIPNKLIFDEQEADPNVFWSKINELIDTVNKQQEIIDDLITNK